MSGEESTHQSQPMTSEDVRRDAVTTAPTQRSYGKLIALLVAVGVVASLIILFVFMRTSTKTPEAKAGTDKPQAPTVLVTRVVSREVNKELRLPGELHAYQNVAVYPKVQGFIESVNVDRGSVVKRGQLLVRMSAPELASRTSEADARLRAAREQRLEMEARVMSAREQRAEATAKLATDEATYRRLKAASATAGVVAENDVDIARGAVDADAARVRVLEQNERAAQAVVKAQTENERATRDAASAVRDMESYLQITAPFDGVVTERNVDRGSLAGPATGPTATPMLRIQQISRLRLVVAVPESDVAGMTTGSRVEFTVPAFPGETFSGLIERISHAVDEKTRTMPVELDVMNESGHLAPGMFPEVLWPTRRPKPSLFVPASAIATTTERTFVIRIRNGATEWVDVKRGISMGELVEVFGNLDENDLVAMRGTDELRSGTTVVTKQSQPSPSPR
jgi:membrane fusion protein (multidrug efflux system)